jgi:hypothetical protein
LNFNFHTPVHEYGHWLLGSAHPYINDLQWEKNVWGMLYHHGDGICANSYERERVAWINPTPITSDILNAPINDYITTGVAYKYHPPNGATDEYYYFENHQKVNTTYDYATSNSNDKGIFVVHQQAPYASNNNIRCKPSNGQWDWNNPYNTTCWTVTVPAFEIVDINRNGYSNRDKLPKDGGGSEWLLALIDRDGDVSCGDYLHGWGLNNSFNLLYNDVFSPYSNPRTHTWANQQTSFTMELFNQQGSIINARFYLTNPIAGKPSKPQYLQVEASQNNHPYLTWDSNTEPDLNKYKIYKFGTYPGGWQYLTQTSNNYYEDVYENICTAIPPAQCESGHNIRYRVTAVDNQQLESIPSDSVIINVTGYIPDKRNFGNTEDVKPDVYALEQNYPNPFNPITIINYSIEKAGFVSLKVYDVLGNEVAVLVSGNEQAGFHSVEFKAIELPSGIYIYTLSSGGFTTSKKLILLK